jgi:hypothetical protein
VRDAQIDEERSNGRQQGCEAPLMHMQVHIFRLRDRQPKLMRFLYDDTISRPPIQKSHSGDAVTDAVGHVCCTDDTTKRTQNGKSSHNQGEYAWTLNIAIDNEVVLRHKHPGILLSRSFLQRYLVDCMHSVGVNAHVGVGLDAHVGVAECIQPLNGNASVSITKTSIATGGARGGEADADGDTPMSQSRSQTVTSLSSSPSESLCNTPELFGCDVDVDTIAAALSAAILAGREWKLGCD